MEQPKKLTLFHAVDSAKHIFQMASGRSYRLLHQYILDISQNRSIDDILYAASKCLKDLFNYELFGFAMKSRENYDLWVDPDFHENALLNIVQRDFAGQKNDFYVHTLGADANLSRKKSDNFSQGDIISYLIVNDVFRARLYVLPRRNVLFQQEHLKIIVRSLGIALENAMRIQHLENIAAIDPLTNCYNRRAFTKHLETSIAFSKRYDRSLTVMMIDLDDFKRVNDTYGHGMGDQVLKAVSSLIASSVRQSDYLARYGGEEFVLLMPETGLYYAIQIAEKLRKRIAGLDIELGGRTIGVTASFGVAELKKDMCAATFLHAADVMLYAAKDHGKNTVAPMLDRKMLIPAFGSTAPVLQCSWGQ